MLAGDVKEWEAAARHAIEVSPGWALALNLLGACYVEQKLKDQAVPTLRAALEADPALQFPYSNLYRALAGTDECESLGADAERLYRQADPASREGIRAAQHWAAAMILDAATSSGDPAGIGLALHLAKTVEARQIWGEALVEQARLAAKAGDRAGAVKLIGQAVKVLKHAGERDRAFGLREAGLALAELGERVQAERTLRESADLATAVEEWTVAYSSWSQRCEQLDALGETEQFRRCSVGAIPLAARTDGYGVIEGALLEGCPEETRSGKDPCACVRDALKPLELMGEAGECVEGVLLAECLAEGGATADWKSVGAAAVGACAKAGEFSENEDLTGLHARALDLLGRHDEAAQAS